MMNTGGGDVVGRDKLIFETSIAPGITQLVRAKVAAFTKSVEFLEMYDQLIESKKHSRIAKQKHIGGIFTRFLSGEHVGGRTTASVAWKLATSRRLRRRTIRQAAEHSPWRSLPERRSSGAAQSAFWPAGSAFPGVG
jgi:hypothetical protein